MTQQLFQCAHSRTRRETSSKQMSEEQSADIQDTCTVGEVAEGVDMTEEAADFVDEYGIPVTIKHTPQNLFTPVWQYIHRLTVPRPSSQRADWPFTHICIVCAGDFKGKDATATAWLTCLMRQKTSSNARLHMLRQHKSHPYSVDAAKEAAAIKLGKTKAHDAETPPPDPNAPKPKKQRTLVENLVVKDDEMRIMTTRWLLSSGLPHTIFQNPELLHLMRRSSNRPNLTFPARETFYGFAEAEFLSFVNLTSAYLQNELLKARGFKFVAMMHDMFTNASNVNVIGVTIHFVSSQWELVELSLLATPSSTGHAAAMVANLIKDKLQTRYGLDIENFARFTVSDTKGSARNVADHFESTDQVDCLMHLLSLCLLYALGLKKNTRQGGSIIVTPGGIFSDGNRVIKQLRNLATFFSSPGRQTVLSQLKDLYNLPRLNIAIDAKTRVGYAATLLRRSIYNWFAFSKYFDRAPSTEQSTWLDISADDWNLMVEMEAITNQMAQFSLGEVQKKGVSSSYVLLFRRLIKMTLEKASFPCLVLERPDVLSTEFTHRRVSKNVTDFSDGGKRYLLRLREQWALRFPQADDNEIKAMLLDPIIKSKAALVVDDVDVLSRVELELEKEHEMIFMALEQNVEVSGEDSTTGHFGALDHQWCSADQAGSSELLSLLAVEAPSVTNMGNSENRSRAAAKAGRSFLLCGHVQQTMGVITFFTSTTTLTFCNGFVTSARRCTHPLRSWPNSTLVSRFPLLLRRGSLA